MCGWGGRGGGRGGEGREGVVIAGKRNSQNNIYIYVFLSYKFLLRFLHLSLVIVFHLL